MQNVHIYYPAKTPMQSGQGRPKAWVLKFVSDLTGREALCFRTHEEAIAYAIAQGYTYTVEQPQKRAARRVNYALNFLCPRVRG